MVALQVRAKAELELRRRRSANEWKLPAPQPKQQAFVDSDADIALFGGGAGSGKSAALLLDFAKPHMINNPQYGGVILRRTYPQIKNEGGLWDESAKFYPLIGGQPKESAVEWCFPQGSTIRFAHLQHEKNIYDWQGAQLARLGFDELTHFTSKQFFYLLSRCRTTIGIKPQIRATCNPDADSWVAEFISWWIDDSGFPDPAKSGVKRWFVRIEGEIIWGDTEEELKDRYPNNDPKSFTFINATIQDNQVLMQADPGYLANLMALHPVDRDRLLHGNWKVTFGTGKVFSRDWFEIIDRDEVPTGGDIVRFWDMAATARSVNADACFTCGVLMKRVGETYYVLNVEADQLSPSDGDDLIVDIAHRDGRFVPVRWELEGGSSGLKVEAYLSQRLTGWDADGVKPFGDKLTRAKPFATEAKRGNVKIVRGDWNQQFLKYLHLFDGSTGKDKVNDFADAASGAYHFLAEGDTNWLTRI